MKRLFVILIMLMYGFSSTGMTLHFHYCCGKLKRVEWVPAKETGCGSKHKMGSKPCCETKQITNKAKADHDNYQPVVKSFKILPETAKPSTEAYLLQPVSRHLSPVAFAPPPLPAHSLFILNCVFRI